VDTEGTGYTMSDILEKLLGVEKKAASLVSDAEEEANRRTMQVRVECQRRHAEALKQKAAEVEKLIQAEQARLASERASTISAYRGELARRSPDTGAFARAARAFIGKGRS
jgi:hypothetical protein